MIYAITTISIQRPFEYIMVNSVVSNARVHRIYSVINGLMEQFDTGLHCLFLSSCVICQVQSTLVISNSKGLSKILRDIRTSTYQSCGSEENT